MGQAGYTPTALRSVAMARHCWIACIQGAQRYVIIPRREVRTEALGARDTTKGRWVSDVDPLRPDFSRNPALRDVVGFTCDLSQGDVLAIPSGCLIWCENLWASLAVRHCFVSQDISLEFQQWLLYTRLSDGMRTGASHHDTMEVPETANRGAGEDKRNVGVRNDTQTAEGEPRRCERAARESSGVDEDKCILGARFDVRTAEAKPSPVEAVGAPCRGKAMTVMEVGAHNCHPRAVDALLGTGCVELDTLD